MSKDAREKGLHELYAEDPVRADRLVFGRVAHRNRRGFLKGAGLAAMGAALGTAIPFHRQMPSGLIPVALAQSTEEMAFAAKDGLTLLNDRPVNAETPPHLLDDDVTPNSRHFVRNNGLVPQQALDRDAAGWSLTVDGLVDTPLTLTLDDLRRDFDVVTLQLTLECGGNGRAFYNPGASGNQWSLGAVASAEYTGVRLRDVLRRAGVKREVVYTAHYGADGHLSGDPGKLPISRGVPIDKAMDEHNLIALEMNGEPLPTLHGFPARLVVPGWPGSCSQKWLRRVQLRDVVHDGTKMTGTAYRVPGHPVSPGTEVPTEDFVIIESMPVKSLITHPATGAQVTAGRPVEVRGHAWAGDQEVAAMDVSLDFGQSWSEARLERGRNRYAWRRWYAQVTPPHSGYYEVWARATDENGLMQPPVTPGWNPKGYINNMMHRIALFAA